MSTAEDRSHAKYEIGGLGLLATPALYNLGKAAIRRKAPSSHDLIEVGGLSVLAVPSIRTLMKKPAQPGKTAAAYCADPSTMSLAEVLDACIREERSSMAYEARSYVLRR